LYDVLLRRRTTRAFDRDASLALWQLAVVLRYVFGYHGYVPLLGQVNTLKRTSPSAGGFHPIEAYPVITGVDELDPGFYHYNGAEHALELLKPLAAHEARAAATEFVCGQTYFADAHVVIVLAARFERAFWKYRNHQKALAALMMDAAHLSQTLYLVATELGLGAFVTAAVNNADVEEQLGLDGYRQGVLAVCGFGKPADEPSPFDPVFRPFVLRDRVQTGQP
jgi:putative peptide maturation dehydrogenase